MIDVLALHRELVAIPSVSGSEQRIADRVFDLLSGLPGEVTRIGNSVVARFGAAPCIVLNSHLDTVPPQDGWSSDPFVPVVSGGRVTGLGSNDAKASVAALIAAYAAATVAPLRCGVVLMLVEGEETLGVGTSRCLEEFASKGIVPSAAIIGEPTSLQSCTCQFGLAILNLIARGDACHAAHAQRLGARNPIYDLARDLSKLENMDFGRTTVNPTVLAGASAKNQIPGTATATLDARLAPGDAAASIVERLRTELTSEVEIYSDRLKSYLCPPDAKLLECIPQPTIESRTMSDMVFFQGIPAVKIGPGDTSRSHTVDEFVMEQEILDGVQVYRDILQRFSEVCA